MAAMRYWVSLCLALTPLAAQDRIFDEKIKPDPADLIAGNARRFNWR
jgi:hypothetical protein